MNRAELDQIADALDRDNRELNWPEPAEIKSDLPPAPRLDAFALMPTVLAEFVMDEADRMPVAPDYVAASLIVCLGSAIGARCAVSPKRRDSWIVTPNLWGAAIGQPATKKTPGTNVAKVQMDRLEAKSAGKLQEAMKVFEAEQAAFEAHEAACKAAMKQAASGKGDAAKMNNAVEALRSLEPPQEPHARRFLTSDTTVQMLGVLLARNPEGILVFRDELTGQLASWDAPGHEGDKAFYLEGWNGTGSFSVDRIGRGSLHIPNLCLSVFGGIQPDLLQRYLANSAQSLSNDGTIQRFQVMVHPEPVEWEWRDRYPLKGAREAVRDVFDRLASFDPVQDGAAPADEYCKLPRFQFDDQAQDLFVSWSTELHREWIKAEQNPLMQQHLSKYEKLFVALSLILHLSEGAVGDVSAASAIRAAAWCEYLRGHARRVYGLLEANSTTTARMVGRRLAEGKLEDGFTVRDLVRKQWSGVTTTMQAEAALATLEEAGWVTGVDIDQVPHRPTTRYLINPRVRRMK